MDEVFTVEVHLVRPDGTASVWVVDNIHTEQEAELAVRQLENLWENATGNGFYQLEDSK